MAVLSRNQILSSKLSDYETVTVEEWGGDVRIRPMNGKQRSDWEYWVTQRIDNDYRGLRERLIISSVVDENCNPVFTEEDEEKLSELSATALESLASEIQRINGLGANEIEEAAKN